MEAEPLIEITTVDQLEEAITDTKTVFLFIHSTTCPISAQAKIQVESFTIKHEEEKNYVYYIINVLEHRDISDLVEKQFDIVHESPQLIVLKDKVVKFHMSHDAVNIDEIEEKLASL